MCDWSGTVARFLTVGSSTTFGVVGTASQGRQLWYYCLELKRSNVTAVTAIDVSALVDTRFLFAVATSVGANILSVYDPSTQQETVILDGSNEVEVYSMSYSTVRQCALIAGLRFSDNRQVVLQVDVPS